MMPGEDGIKQFPRRHARIIGQTCGVSFLPDRVESQVKFFLADFKLVDSFGKLAIAIATEINAVFPKKLHGHGIACHDITDGPLAPVGVTHMDNLHYIVDEAA